MLDLKVPSGSVVTVGAADFEDAIALKNASFKALAASGIKLDVNALSPEETDLGSIISSLMAIDSDAAFNAALWPCLAQCTRNSEMVTKKTFNDVEARTDYYPIAFACIKENLAPFFGGLNSLFNQSLIAMKAMGKSTQK